MAINGFGVTEFQLFLLRRTADFTWGPLQEVRPDGAPQAALMQGDIQ
ncbi:hypothetical protein ACFVXG_32140 [Kitasatospora sp. NPDC058162]